MSGKFMMNGIPYLGGSGGGGGNVNDVYVNGTSVLDSDKIAQITSYEEVTYAEWEALPDTKYEDGIAYFIKDSAEAEGFPPLIYSKEERQIGVWVDGKPLYQKTVKITTTLVSGDNDVSVSTPNLETLVDAWATAKMGNGCWVQISTSNPTANWNLSIYDIDSTKVRFCVGSSIATRGLVEVYVTMQYTKTTDAAGQGIWAGNGALAHHYSSSETIIGTWTDGKPLYEKVVTFTSSSGGYVDVNNLHISKMISCAGFVTQTNGNIVNLPYGAGNNDFAIPYYNTTNGRLYCSYSGSYNVAEWTVILQYTKTTD